MINHQGSGPIDDTDVRYDLCSKLLKKIFGKSSICFKMLQDSTRCFPKYSRMLQNEVAVSG